MKLLMQPGDYFGSTLQKRQINNIILSETHYLERQKIPGHYHEDFYICYVVNGAFSELNQNKQMICRAGDLIIHPEYTEHSNEFHDGKGVCFNIELTNLKQTGLAVPPDKSLSFSNPVLATGIKKAYNEFKFNDQFSAMIIEGLVIETLGYLQRQLHNAAPRWLKKAKEIINDHRDGLSISWLSAELNISPAHLCREFKKAFGMSIGEYLQHLKIAEACKLLKTSDASLLKIALDTGYADQSHFTRAFKRVMSTTPGQYRLMAG